MWCIFRFKTKWRLLPACANTGNNDINSSATSPLLARPGRLEPSVSQNPLNSLNVISKKLKTCKCIPGREGNSCGILAKSCSNDTTTNENDVIHLGNMVGTLIVTGTIILLLAIMAVFLKVNL